MVVVKCLVLEGYTVTACMDGVEALHLIASSTYIPDLVPSLPPSLHVSTACLLSALPLPPSLPPVLMRRPHPPSLPKHDSCILLLDSSLPSSPLSLRNSATD